jgi:hypothetical protein
VRQKITSITDIRDMKTRIIVFGVGGAGGNAVNNMIMARNRNGDAVACPLSKSLTDLAGTRLDRLVSDCKSNASASTEVVRSAHPPPRDHPQLVDRPHVLDAVEATPSR